MNAGMLLHGILTGWVAVLLVARSGVLEFVPFPPPLGIVSACFASGYPKQQDWFWYAAMLAGGVAGAVLNAALAALLNSLGKSGLRGNPPLVAGWVCLVIAATGALSAGGVSVALAALLGLVGWLLPWFSLRWTADSPFWIEALPPSRRFLAWWTFGAALAALALTCVSCMSLRPLDGLHEGGQLVYVQSWLAGNPPGLASRTQYGPLYAHSLAWWMKAFGLTVSSARGYFVAAQFLGTFIHLVLLGLAVRSLPVLAAGAWLMLILSPAPNIQFGWANSLRTALPLAALWLCGAGSLRLPLSGAIAALGWLYSAEYGMAGILACLLVLVLGARHAGIKAAAGRAMAWGAGVVAALAAMLGLMYGGRVLESLGPLLGGGYILARLQGHAVSPLPSFPWWDSLDAVVMNSRRLEELAAIWGPGMLCVATAGLLMPARGSRTAGSAPFIWGLAVFTLLAQVPVIARPLWQISTSMPPAILLAAVMGDALLRGGAPQRAAAWGALAAAILYGWAILSPMTYALSTKYTCFGAAAPASPPPLERLGSVQPGARQAAEMSALVAAVRKRCPPGGRIYLAAPRLAWVCFLADRAALAPFPLTYLAATREERLCMVAALEKGRPALAVITQEGIDLTFAAEHPEEKAWLERNYRMAERTGGAELWIPRVRPARSRR